MHRPRHCHSRQGINRRPGLQLSSVGFSLGSKDSGPSGTGSLMWPRAGDCKNRLVGSECEGRTAYTETRGHAFVHIKASPRAEHSARRKMLPVLPRRAPSSGSDVRLVDWGHLPSATSSPPCSVTWRLQRRARVLDTRPSRHRPMASAAPPRTGCGPSPPGYLARLYRRISVHSALRHPHLALPPTALPPWPFPRRPFPRRPFPLGPCPLSRHQAPYASARTRANRDSVGRG
jgi:hypothetical protein